MVVKSLQNFQKKTGLNIQDLTGTNSFQNETGLFQVIRDADCRTTLTINNGLGHFLQFMYCPGAKVPYIRVDYMTIRNERLAARNIFEKDGFIRAGGTNIGGNLFYKDSDWSDLDRAVTQYLEAAQRT